MVEFSPSRAGRTWRRYRPAILWAAIVFVASVAPTAGTGVSAPGPFGVGVDVWLHVAGYAVLGVLLARAMGARAAAVVVAAAFGVGVESVQLLVPSRTASVGDAAANLLGAVGGVAVAASRSLRRNQLDDGE